jgi:universal stress protein E
VHRFGTDLRLLVATDMTPRSDRAVERAVKLAGTWQAPLTILHVVNDELPQSTQRVGIEEAEQVLAAQISPWRESGVNVVFAVIKGHDYEAIIAQAQKEEAKFIVMGTHRKMLMREHWLGTTVDQVVRYGDRPVLVVRQLPLRAYEKIVVAVDFSQPSRLALEFALLLFPGAIFTVLHSFHVPFKAFQPSRQTTQQFFDLHEKEMIQFIQSVVGDFRVRFGEISCEIKTVIEEGFPTDVVHQQVHSQKPDLVVIGTHGRSGFRQAVLGSIAEELISTLSVDVLAVKAPCEVSTIRQT